MATKGKVGAGKRQAKANAKSKGAVAAAEPAAQSAADMTGDEIAALPRRKTVKTKVPPEGIYIGSGVYHHSGCLNGSGFCFTYWAPEGPDMDQIVPLAKEHGVGNTLQFWQHGEELMKLAKQAKAAGLYTVCLYSSAPPEISKRLIPELGDWYLGYDFGERYNFALDTDWGGQSPSLHTLVDEYMGRVAAYVRERQKAGWGNIMATSANFSLDYEIAAGTEVPCTEDFPFGDLTLASALSRGLYRQYDLPMWGSHLAHEWYSWIPHRNPYKMKTLETAFLLKYMTGSKLVINESGNWALQSNLCEDSPMSLMPILPGNPPGLYGAKDPRSGYTEEALEEARKRFPYIDFRSPVATKYRQIIADFHSFCKEHPAPKGQPETTIALAKGNLDLGDARYIPAAAVCGAYNIAEKNPDWYHGLPEMSWEVARNAIMPMPPILAPNKNIHFSATPYGLVDLASFACDNITADFLLRNYKCLMFSGWNTCSEKQYKVLCDYVHGGGRLVIGLCHLSTDDKRNYHNFGLEDLVNKGDLSELCGVKVKGRTARRYWATGPSTTPNCLGIKARRRFGYMELPLGDLEYTLSSDAYEMLAVDDETAYPVIIRCKSGKGEVFLMNWWGYPAAANMDVGCGAEEGGVGLAGKLYQYVAKISRGHVFITGDDFENPDEDCRYIVESYFPDEGKIYLLNLDYANERKCILNNFGDIERITLAPAEFRIVESVVLKPHEKFNEL